MSIQRVGGRRFKCAKMVLMSHRSRNRKPAPKPTLSSLARRVNVLERELGLLRAKFERSRLALAADELRELNNRQATEGLARVQADVRELLRRGIVHKDGKRIWARLPNEVKGSETDVM